MPFYPLDIIVYFCGINFLLLPERRLLRDRQEMLKYRGLTVLRNECLKNFNVPRKKEFIPGFRSTIKYRFFIIIFFSVYMLTKSTTCPENMFSSVQPLYKKKINQNCSCETCRRSHFPPLYYFFSDHRRCSIQA